ncbi:MAG: glycosyltransferase family 2 protein [Chlamydiota bacterium]
MTDLSLVVVSWNSSPYLRGCLSSIPAGAGKLSFEVFVVDNASRDGSADLVRAEFPSAHLIANTVNRGFAAANNQGLRLATGRYALLLNPDTRVHEGALERLAAFMDGNPDAGACGPLLLNEDGSVQHAARRFPTFGFAFGSKTVLGRLGFFRRSYDRVKMRGERFDEAMEVDQPSGAALFLRRSVLDRVGLLDEGYFIFFEEVDLCRRIRDAGCRIVLRPEARITHYGGRSRRQNRAAVILPGARSLLRYFRKHEGGMRSAFFDLAFRPLFALGICVDAAGAGLKASLYRLRPGKEKKAAEKEAIFAAYCAFIRRDLLFFLLSLWE